MVEDQGRGPKAEGREGALPLSRRAFVSTAAAFVVAPNVLRHRYQIFPWSQQQYSERAVRLVRDSIVVDMLGLLSIHSQGSRWLENPDTFVEKDLARFRDSGITALHPAVGIGGPDAQNSTIHFFARWNGFVANQDAFVRIDSGDDFVRAKQAGKIGIIMGVQNSEHFRRLDDVNAFHAAGQRVSQLTYNARNMIGNGSTERRDEGLSDFGVAIVERMNQVGIAVDVSHCGDRTSIDACEVSKRPVLITHSNARALAPGHPRCKPDEAIKAMAKSGGVMGITAVRMFVKNDEPTTVEHVLDHFDHVKKLIGPQHLGVGSDIDLDGYDDMPPAENQRLRAGYKGSYGFREKIDVEGLDHPKRMYDLTEGLIRRKYSDAEITGVLGGNFVRVLSEIWKV